MTKKANILYPSMLAFARSLEFSEFLMFGEKPGKEGEDKPIREMIEVLLTGQRGQTSHAGENNKKKGVSKAGKSNPQMLEIARMPVGFETLVIEGRLRVLPNSCRPSATDMVEAYDGFQQLSEDYAKLGGYKALAERYVENIANGRFAWRNASIADNARVEVEAGDLIVKFDTSALAVGEILGLDAVKEAVIDGAPEDVDKLVDLVTQGLSQKPVMLRMAWKGQVAPTTEVYPSQEYRRVDEDADDKTGRLLSWVRVTDRGEVRRQATMHSQKIGAAVRAIDDWHGNDLYGAIPVNAYGGVQESGFAIRHQDKSAPSYFDLAKKPQLFMEDMAEGVLNANAHFFMANLVRGGVYGGKD